MEEKKDTDFFERSEDLFEIAPIFVYAFHVVLCIISVLVFFFLLKGEASNWISQDGYSLWMGIKILFFITYGLILSILAFHYGIWYDESYEEYKTANAMMKMIIVVMIMSSLGFYFQSTLLTIFSVFIGIFLILVVLLLAGSFGLIMHEEVKWQQGR